LALIRTNAKSITNDWNATAETDWVNGYSSGNLPKDAVMRALWKTPISIHVGSCLLQTTTSEVLFRCKVITHTDNWMVEKTMRDFEDFRNGLPLGTTLWFKQPFPSFFPLNILSGMGGLRLSSADLDSGEAEKKRQMLDEWLRELTLNEKCMTNAEVLERVRSFVGSKSAASEVAAHRSALFIDAPVDGSCAVAASASQHFASTCSPLSAASASADAASGQCGSLLQVLKKIRKFGPEAFPVTVSGLDEMLKAGPFRLDLADFRDLEYSGAANADADDEQLKKDMSRDRLVINGRRFQGGSLSSFQQIVDATTDAMAQAALEAQLPSLAPTDADRFAKSLLRQLSRTESAYVSLRCLHTIVDIFGSSSSTSDSSSDSGSGEGGSLVMVPEALLAEPMALRLEILERKQQSQSQSQAASSSSSSLKECCLDCEQQTSTVYRFCDDVTMSTHLQIRVVYSRRTYGMLAPGGGNSSGGSIVGNTSSSSSGSGSSGGSSIVEKAGPSYLVLIRETKTTDRDWQQSP
jgi:hypothetical protein